MNGFVVKPLEWECLGGRTYRAEAPLFGNLRVEPYGVSGFTASYSVPGFSALFLTDEFDSAEEAQAAIQAEYERRIRSVLSAGWSPPSQARAQGERIERLVAALELYESAIAEAEAIFGGEYANDYGPMFEMAMAARDARDAQTPPHPAAQPQRKE